MIIIYIKFRSALFFVAAAVTLVVSCAAVGAAGQR